MMRFLALVVVLVSAAPGPVAWADEPEEPEEVIDSAEIELPGGECLACHLTTDDNVGELWNDDVHARAGITCVTCHGGDDTKADKDLAKRPGTKYRGALTPRQAVDSCGGCHSDAEYMKERKPLCRSISSRNIGRAGMGSSSRKGNPRSPIAPAATTPTAFERSTTPNHRSTRPTSRPPAAIATPTPST